MVLNGSEADIIELNGGAVMDSIEVPVELEFDLRLRSLDHEEGSGDPGIVLLAGCTSCTSCTSSCTCCTCVP
jgi:hypothetical protein